MSFEFVKPKPNPLAPADRSLYLSWCEHNHTSPQTPHHDPVRSPSPRVADPLPPPHHVHSLRLDEPAPVFGLLALIGPHDRESLVAASGPSGTLELWDLSLFARSARLAGHSRAVTAVACDASVGRLYSAARDGIKAWDLRTHECVATVLNHRGAIYSMAASNGWLFAGGQDTLVHAFAPGPGLFSQEQLLRGHSGFVFAVCAWGDRLFSAGGDADIVLWERNASGEWGCARRLRGHTGAVLNLAIDGDFLYSVGRDGTLKLWDLETFMLARSLALQASSEGGCPARSEMVAVTVSEGLVFAASGDGVVAAWQKPSLAFVGTLRSTGCCGVVSLATSRRAQLVLVGGSKGDVSVWQHDALREAVRQPSSTAPLFGRGGLHSSLTDALPAMLAQFVALPSISGSAAHRGDCFACAKWLRNYCVALGLDARLEQPDDASVNPLVYARIGDNPSFRTVCFYAHYDVVAAGEGWESDPWTLRGHNGHLYGRGATDDKGPLLACLLAVAQLAASGELRCNVRFLVEGEEESGSKGVLESVSRNQEYFGSTDLLLLSNNYFLGEDRPSLIYGLRGVIYLRVRVSGPRHTNHSGIDGGAFREPMLDLIAVLASLTDASGRVTVPGFYEDVRSITEAERGLYEDITFDSARYAERAGLTGLLVSESPTELLMRRWRFPNLSIAAITSDTGHASTIPKEVMATVSIRTVPDQKHPALIASLTGHLERAFAALQSRNKLVVEVVREGTWWLGDPFSPAYQAAAAAVAKVWDDGRRPMFTREGGSIPILSNLQSLLRGPETLILPLGQATDNAHLANEHISLQGLVRGVEIFKLLFQQQRGDDGKLQ